MGRSIRDESPEQTHHFALIAHHFPRLLYIGRLVRIQNAVLFFGLWASMALALPFYGNQSTTRWKSAETEHFRFHYPVEFQGQSGKVVSFAEAVHDSIESRYRIKLPGRVDMVIRNSLFSNGVASPMSNTMNVWLTDWDFKVRSTHPWMNDVVTHEFSHLVSMQSGSKLPPFIYGLQFTKQDYYNEKVQENGSVIYPFSIFPLWLAEGTAQYESARMGFDAWDTHRDMLFRTSILADSLLPLSQMEEFPDDGLGSEKGPYNQGFNLVLYIAERFGDQAIPNLWSEMARIHRVTFAAACERVLGISEDELLRDWKQARLDAYLKERDRLGVLHTGTKRTTGAFWHDFPQIVEGKLWGVSNMGSPWFDGSLFRIPLKDSLPEDQKPDSTGAYSAGAFAEQPFQLVKPWLDKGFSIRARTDASPLIAYVSYKHRDRNGRPYFDIAIDDTSKSPWFGDRKTLRFATSFADAVYPDLSPDAKQVVFVRREQGGSRFFLSRAIVPEQGSSAEDYVDLLAPPDSLSIFAIYNPKWSPDGKQIAFSFYDGISRKVAVIGADGKGVKVLAQGASDNRDPAWTPDGSGVIFSSDRTGIFNLYRQNLADSTGPKALTNVLGGAFTPTLDSNRIWYVGYDTEGFSLYEIKPDSSLALTQGPRQAARMREITIGNLELAAIERPYRPLPVQPILVPMILLEDRADDLGSIRKGVVVPKAGFALGLSDPLQKNFIQLALLCELGKGYDFINTSGINPEYQTDFMAFWENHSYPITLSVGYAWKNVASMDTLRYEDPRSYEDSISVTHMAINTQSLEAGAGYSIWKQGDSLVLGAGGQWNNFNLYEDGFDWDYHKNTYLSATALYERGVSEEGPSLMGEGDGAAFRWQGSRSWLYRPGTFQESFTVNEQGVISPKYRQYSLQELWFSSWMGFANPLHSGARLVGSVQMSAIANWQGKSAHTDTLDDFYHHSLWLAGYPLLADAENLAIHGDRTAQAQLHYLFPLYSNWDARWWIFTAKSMAMDFFAQTGSAWDQQVSFRSRFEKREFWKRSVGVELRWSNRIFMNQSFDLWLNLARGLDRIETSQGMVKLDPVDMPLLPSKVSPTGIAFGIGIGFSDPWRGAAANVRGPQ